uniref:transglycosylase SLT domain-containing protein n=1 Tax=Hyalangium versicolor TaxID=2861190 RepID=UPI001CC961A4
AALTRALPSHARQYARAISKAAKASGVDALLLAAVLEQESNFGATLTPPGPAGKGDKGHGHGVGQIDDRTWGAWIASSRWWDFETNATKAGRILADALKAMGGNVRAGVSAYNGGAGRVKAALAAGKDPGSVTTHTPSGESYPDGVLRRLERLKKAAQQG